MLNLGEAAHITAAAPGGPRYDSALTPEQRKSHENGIWCCAICATAVDKDDSGHTAEQLREWKRIAEERSSESIKPLQRSFDNPLIAFPYDENLFFAARTAELTRLDEQFKETNTRKIHAITGLGGVGKTQLAIKYALTAKSKYSAIVWIDGSPDGLHASVSETAKRAQFPPTIDGLHEWLQSHSRWLLILDNVEPKANIAEILPAGLVGHILITTREEIPQSLGIVSPTRLAEFTDEESLAFLLKRTSRQQCALEQIGAAKALCKELGGLPLALEQAAAYIVTTGCLFQDYLGAFKKRRLELLNKSRPAIGSYGHTVATTWSLNFSQVMADSAQGGKLFRLAAFCAGDKIPFWVFREGADGAPSLLKKALKSMEENPLAMRELLASLRKYSLITVDSDRDSFQIHRLVQEVQRSMLRTRERRALATRLTSILAHAFPGVDHSNWNRCDEWLPHASEICKHGIELGIGTDEAACLLHNTVHALSQREQFDGIVAFAERAKDILTRLYGADDQRVLWQVARIASAHVMTGNMEAAKTLMEPLEAHGDNDYVQMVIGEYYLNCKDLGRAEKSFRKLYAVSETRPPQKPTDIEISALMGLGMAKTRQGKGQWPDAEKYLILALRKCVELYGKEQPLEADLLHEYCPLLRKLGRASEARPLELRLRIIRIQQDLKYPSKPHTLYPHDVEDLFEHLGQLSDEATMDGLGKRKSTLEWAEGPQGRNSMCTCGTYKKHKNCCGKKRV